jgi:hypothetical protein
MGVSSLEFFVGVELYFFCGLIFQQLVQAVKRRPPVRADSPESAPFHREKPGMAASEFSRAVRL